MTDDQTREFCDQLIADWRQARLKDADAAMLEYVCKLSDQPDEMRSADVERLRDNGFDDRAIHDICCVAAYYEFVNRIADGLGVELEADFTRS